MKGYLIYKFIGGFEPYIDKFMAKYQSDEVLAELLFDFLLNKDYDGSDCQIGAAIYISRRGCERSLTKKGSALVQTGSFPKMTFFG